MKISELAKMAGVHVETVRYYQRIALLAEPDKPDRGFRNYNEESLDRLLFIRRAKELGFSLSDIRELLALQDKPEHCNDICTLAEKNLLSVRSKIRSLQELEVKLDRLIEDCRANSDCIILETLTARRRTGPSVNNPFT